MLFYFRATVNVAVRKKKINNKDKDAKTKKITMATSSPQVFLVEY